MTQEKTAQQMFVERIMNLYLVLPETPSRASRTDRRLADELYEKGIREEEVEAALLLATARRLLRSGDAPKLGPIRSLHYFLPVLEEVRSNPLSASYVEYLRRKVAARADIRLPDSYRH
jgi:hypothetical protein